MLLVGQQEGHPVCKKTKWWYAGVFMCLGQSADLHMAQLMPLPSSSSSSSCSFNKKFDRLQTNIDVYMQKAQLDK